MDRAYLSRTLSYTGADGVLVELHDDELVGRNQPLVILGEAGMGKTVLLEQLSAAHSLPFVSARRLLRNPDPRTLAGDATCLLIDALDEVSAASEGDVVDQVLRQLLCAGKLPFILSCRAGNA